VASAATVTTNFPDYPPGDTVWISGAGFASHESVTVVVEHVDTTITGGLGHDPWKVKANNGGNITTYWIVPYDDNVGETLRVEATGNSSALFATTTFTDVNTILTLTSVLADTFCPGESVQVCANLLQNCGGGSDQPLYNRPLIFFFNPGNCGVDVGQNGQDTVYTDSAGNACATLSVPTTPGNYTIRVKFLGEDKPSPCPTPGNSACDPFDPNSNKRCVELSNSNVCEPVVVDSAACCAGDNPPVVIAPDSTKTLCSADTIKFTVTATDADAGDTLTLEKISGPGTFTTVTGTSPLSGQLKHYVTASGTYTYIFKVTDECGAVDYDTAVWTVTLNSPPVITFQNDTSVFQCSPASICVNYLVSDPNGLAGLVETKISGPGTIDTLNNKVCFTPGSSGSFTIIVKVTDPCGAYDQDTVVVTVNLNDPPSIAFGNDTSLFQCTPASICANYTVSDPDGLAGLVETLVSGPGTIDTLNNKVCFTPASSGSFTFIVRVTDPCGVTDQDTVVVTVNLNDQPTIALGSDFTVNQCTPQQICVPYTVSDPDGLAGIVETKVSGPGTIDTLNNQVCFTPSGSGTFTIIVKATDPCGAFDQDTINVTVTGNTKPQFIICPTGPDPLLCPGDSVCVWFHAIDNDGDYICITQMTSAPGSFVGGTGPGGSSLCGDSAAFGYFCLIPDTSGTYCISLVVTDSCGGKDTCSLCIVVQMNQPPTVTALDGTLHLCAPDSLKFQVCGTDPDSGDTITLMKTSGPGTFPTKTGLPPQCDTLRDYITAAGTYTYIFKVTDKCGATDYDTAVWVVTFDAQAPVVTAPDGSKFLCGPDSLKFQVCGTDSDAGDTITVMKTSGSGTFPTKIGLSPQCDTLRDYITVAGTYTYIFKVTDECGKVDYDTAVWVITFNNPPVVTAKDTTVALCAPDTIRIPVCVTDPNAGDTVALIKTSGGGVFAGKTGLPPFCDTLKFYATAVGTSTFIFKVTDECGATDFDTATITVTKINQPPTVTAPDSTKKLCAPGNISFVVCASDSNAGDTITLEKTSGIGTFCTKTGVTPQCCTLTASIPSSGTYTWIFKVTNSCGAVDYDTATWTITVNNPPVVTAPDGNLNLCSADTLKFAVCATDPDAGDTLTLIKTSGPGTFAGKIGLSPVCDTLKYYVTAAGTYTFIFKVTDKCGATDYDTATWVVGFDAQTPVVTAPDGSKSLCAPDTLKFQVCGTDSDLGDTLTLEKISGPGTFPTKVGVSPVCDTLRHYITTAGTYTYVFKVTDECGKVDFDTAVWTITKVNQPPTVTAPDSTKNLCGPGNISFTVCASDPDAGDTITLEKTSGIGTFCTKTGVTPQCCTLSAFIPSAGTYTWIFKVTNSCGATDYDTATWTINFTGQPPAMLAGADKNRSICPGDTICFTVSANHPTNNPVKIEKISGPGNACSPAFSVNPSCEVCFAPASAGQYCFIFRATEQNCNLTDEDTVCVNVSSGEPPFIIPGPDTIKVCPGNSAVFIVRATNPSGDSVCIEKASGPGSFPTVCDLGDAFSGFTYLVPDENCYPVVFKASSDCGEDFDTVVICGDSSQCEVCIHVKIDCPEGDPGENLWLPILIQNNVEIGGFDLVVEFNNTDITVVKVERGDAIDDTNSTGKFNWHYFTYRLDPSTVIHKYKIHLVGVGKLYSSYPGICLGPNPGFVELAKIRVVLANNELLRCFQTPVFFEWDSFTCLENTFSDCSGNTLYVSNNYNQFNPDSCPALDKNRAVLPCVLFEDGCVRFRCPQDVDPIVIGDINVNGFPYEVADAVLFSSYFIYGESVFSSDYDTRQAQIGGSDVNRDGFVLSIADLVYLLRILVGDQAPLGEGTSLTNVSGYQADFDGRFVEVSAQKALGAALFVFNGEGMVTPLAQNLTIISNAAEGQTKVLVYGLSKGSAIPAGNTKLFSIKGKVELSKVEAADYYANPVEVQISSGGNKPTTYNLSQNYPNPFNATTSIKFALPVDGKVTLKIYNLAGQVVKVFQEQMSAGYQTIVWDGTNSNGEKVASGVYFYRLDVGAWTDIKKMLLLK
jgi:hypothetical protein